MARKYTPVSKEEFAGAELAAWSYEKDFLNAHFDCGTFAAAGEFASSSCKLADDADHHPEVDIRYPGVVVVRLSTHVTSGVTDADVELAATIESLYKSSYS